MAARAPSCGEALRSTENGPRNCALGKNGTAFIKQLPPPITAKLSHHLCECPEGLSWSRRSPGAEWSQVPPTGAVRCHLGKAGCCGHRLRAHEAKLLPGIVTVDTSLLVSLPAGLSLLQAEGWTLPGGLQLWLISLYFLLDVQHADLTIPPSTEHLLYSKAPGVVSVCTDACNPSERSCANALCS